MTSRMEDYSELLETLDEILQEEHDVEIAASAKAIRALIVERDELKAEMEIQRKKEVEEVMWRECHIEELEAEVKRLREALAKTSISEGGE